MNKKTIIGLSAVAAAAVTGTAMTSTTAAPVHKVIVPAPADAVSGKKPVPAPQHVMMVPG